MTDSLLIAVHAFVSRVSMSVSVDERERNIDVDGLMVIKINPWTMFKS